jgi:BirA family biotin operon repressor/biotin-[acetyl-CoA-carboxylase] ligase
MAAALSQAAGRLGAFGRQVQWYAELPSTNDLAGAFADHGVREGSIVIANSQTAGRGRQGRQWCSPPGGGLYVSIVLRPHARAVPLLTIAAGVALAEGIRDATGLAAALKWPNDVMVIAASNFRKLAGILAEAGGAAAPGCEPHVVLGFGINLRPAAYPPEVASRATSLEEAIGHEPDRGRVLAECLAAWAARYDELQGDRPGVVLEAWRSFAQPFLGRDVEWDGRDGTMRGVASDVDGAGALLVRTPAGTVRVIGGEVRWI